MTTSKTMPDKKRMPDERVQRTYSTIIGGVKYKLTFGFYEDGKVGEINLRGGKTGTEDCGALSAWSVMASKMIQRGLIDEVISECRGYRFEPDGMTTDKAIPMVSSPIDWAVRRLEIINAGGIAG